MRHMRTGPGNRPTGRSSPLSEVFHQPACAYCHRAGQLLEPCCDRAEHARRLVCADAHECLGVVLGLLHESDARLAGPVPVAAPAAGRRLCAHAGQDGEGMHWLQPGEVCARAAEPGEAERQARLTAGSALLADFLRWTAGETMSAQGAGDWQAWADRLAAHLGWVIEAASR
jgi:hypothetical protein